MVCRARELAHQVPRAQLAALVERQEQAGAEPEDAHGRSGGPARGCRRGDSAPRPGEGRDRGAELLHAVAVDPRAVPELEVEEAPERCRRHRRGRTR